MTTRLFTAAFFVMCGFTFTVFLSAFLAAFDTGVGTGSMSAGWLIQRFGFSTAFAVAAVLSTVALPYFLVADRNLRKT